MEGCTEGWPDGQREEWMEGWTEREAVLRPRLLVTAVTPKSHDVLLAWWAHRGNKM